MKPRELRARARLSLDEMASRLGIPVDDLRTLEGTATDLWEVRDLRRYLKALGYDLSVQAWGATGFEVLS